VLPPKVIQPYPKRLKGFWATLYTYAYYLPLYVFVTHPVSSSLLTKLNYSLCANLLPITASDLLRGSYKILYSLQTSQLRKILYSTVSELVPVHDLRGIYAPCACVCAYMRVRKGYLVLVGAECRKAVIKMKYNVNNVSKLFARNVCTVVPMFVINWTHKTVTNIRIHRQFKRLYGSKNLCNVSSKHIKQTHKATKMLKFVLNAVRLVEAKRTLNNTNRISLFEV
jgi:hypothetical protein